MVPTTFRALCPEPRSYQIETQEGITYRRTQNHLKPFKLHQKTQTNKQYQQKCLNTNRMPVNNNCKQVQAHPKRQIKKTCKT